MHGGVIPLAELMQRRRKIGMRFDILGARAQRSPIVIDGFARKAGGHEHIRQVVVGLRVVRLEAQGLAISANGFLASSPIPKQVGEIVVRRGVIGSQPDRFAVFTERFVEAT